jgi:hypothetical protein
MVKKFGNVYLIAAIAIIGGGPIRLRHLRDECNVSTCPTRQDDIPAHVQAVLQEMDIAATSTNHQVNPAQVQDQKCKAVSLRRWPAAHGLLPCAQGFSPIDSGAGRQSCVCSTSAGTCSWES